MLPNEIGYTYAATIQIWRQNPKAKSHIAHAHVLLSTQLETDLKTKLKGEI